LFLTFVGLDARAGERLLRLVDTGVGKSASLSTGSSRQCRYIFVIT